MTPIGESLANIEPSWLANVNIHLWEFTLSANVSVSAMLTSAYGNLHCQLAYANATC